MDNSFLASMYPRSFKVRVTQKDIDLGDQQDPNYCAIARAVKRQYPGLTVGVNSEVEIISKTAYALYDLPTKADKFITEFDNDKSKVKPFNFVMKLNQIKKLGAGGLTVSTVYPEDLK